MNGWVKIGLCWEWVTVQSLLDSGAEEPAKGPCFTFSWPEHGNICTQNPWWCQESHRIPLEKDHLRIIKDHITDSVILGPDDWVTFDNLLFLNMKTWPIDSLSDNERWNATTSKGPWKVKIIRRQGNNSWVAWGKPCDQHGQSETPHNVSSLTNWASPHVSKLFFCLQRSTNLSKVQSYKCAVVMRSHFKLAAAHRKSKAVLSSIVCRSSDFYCSFASVFSSESHPQSALLSRSSRVQALDFSKDLEKVLRLTRSWNPPTW